MFSRSELTGIDVSLFPDNYRQARQEWLKRLPNLNYPQQYRSFNCAGVGPMGEELITDSVWLGENNAKQVLILLAGTHGIEGFTGSAIQLDLMDRLACQQILLPDNTAILLIHALTPWGYAWLRRCDADGVDLNRNAVDFTQPLPENPDYQQLRSALFCNDISLRQEILANFAHQHGRPALEQAISGGQYQDPAGPFYGGQKPAHGRLVCEALMADYALAKRRLAVIDVHTGLGPYSYGEIICDHQPFSAGATMAYQWYGEGVTLPFAGTSSSVPKLGLLDYLWHAVMDQQSCFVTLEFGTFSTDLLFETLLRDHQLWSETNNQTERQAHSLRMRKHFYPEDIAWQEMVLFRARQVIMQGLRGVSR
ncbi:DUF2817 domain-containing protein [Methylomonas sp. AM2-LC]|uniref:DUF2817 domain-containing protein n=1 Tax=Methylomonas sp. AM2-LC TaxID=3153301 RepID=UPI003266484A